MEIILSDSKPPSILSKETPDGKHSTQEKRISELLTKSNSLPTTSGCYFMKGQHGEILYVGKAKNLKNRVKTYFNKSSKTPKTQILVGHIYDFDFILTQTEAESFILENNLIKEHKPKYNIMLRDDKSYPYVAIDSSQSFPRLLYVRRPKRAKNMSFYGPFPVGFSLSSLMRVLTKAFRLRDCSEHEFNSRKTPCMLYQMNQCSAPCVGLIKESKYQEDLELALNIFRSNKKAKITLEYLTQRMMQLAEEEKFETAAMVRDYIEQLDEFNQKTTEQNVESLSSSNCDVISFYPGENEVDISLYIIRQGNLIGNKNFHFLMDDLLGEIEDEIVLALIQYYAQNSEVIPEKIVVDLPKSKTSEFSKALEKVFGDGVKFKVQAKTKSYESILSATRSHAEECQKLRIKNQDSVYIGLNKLKEILKLKERPKLLECYDIAVWQGKSPTAAQIVFYEGKPDKTQYRHYHMEERPEGNNDFAMMKEVFSRRLKRGNLPDVFIVDGGVQQVSTVIKVLEEFKVQRPVVGIAKSRDLKKIDFRTSNSEKSSERLIIPNRSNPYILSKCPSLMRVVVQMRDEAHRFSRRLHHKTEEKRVIRSWVDEVKGLSEKMRTKILQENTLTKRELKELELNDLQEKLGLNPKHARIVFQYLHAEEN